MGYVRTAGMSTAARRRRRRAALVLTALALALLLVFGYAVAYFQGWLPAADGDANDAAATSAPADPGLAPEDVVVNVVNNVGTEGLAGHTAEALETHGYTVDGVSDDSQDVQVEGVDLRHGPAGQDAARHLQQEIFPDARLVPVERQGSVVDVVLGEGFEELPPAEQGEGG